MPEGRNNPRTTLDPSKLEEIAPLDRQALTRFARQALAAEQWPAVAEAFGRLAAEFSHVNNAFHLSFEHRRAIALHLDGRFAEAIEAYELAAKEEPGTEAWLRASGSSIRNIDTHSLQTLWLIGERIASPPSEPELIEFLASERATAVRHPEKLWFVVYVSLMKRGWVHAAYLAKSIAAEALAQCQPSVTPNSAHQIFLATALADIGNFGEALQVARNATETSVRDRLSQYPGYDAAAGHSLLFGDRSQAQELFALALAQSAFREADAAYEALVWGKSIAIVAPGTNAAHQGHEIDSFDLIVRTNFRTTETIDAHAKRIGTRTDIAYYNGNFEPDKREEIVSGVRDANLKFLVLRMNEPEAVNAYGQIVPVRVSATFNAFYRMNTYAIPKIVHDLMRFRPKRMKIFNADFFLSERPHYDGYLDYDIDVQKSLRNHDVVRNFRLMKLWYDQGYVEADSVLSAILAKSEEQVIGLVGKRIRSEQAKRRLRR